MILLHDRLARCLAMLPALCMDVADDLAMDPDVVRRYMRFLHAEGVVCPGEIIQHRGRIYETGTLQQFERVGAKKPPPALLQFSAVWRALHRRQTVAQLAQSLTLPERSVVRIVSAMHRHRVARIAAWQWCGRQQVPLFDLLPGSDAPKPYKPKAESNADYWARRRERLYAAGLSTRASVQQIEGRA